MFTVISVMLLTFSSPVESGKKMDQIVYNLNWPTKPRTNYYMNNDYDDCILSLFEDGLFSIEIVCSLTNDIITGYSLSAGQYVWEGDSLLLLDTHNHLKLKLVQKQDTLAITEGFPFMRGFSFEFSHKRSSNNRSFKTKENHLITNQMDYSVSDERPLNDLQYRSYVWHYDLDYSIIISEDNTYKIMDSNLLLSEGCWERKENLLIMHDNSFICEYYAVIGDNELYFIPIGFSTIKTFK